MNFCSKKKKNENQLTIFLMNRNISGNPLACDCNLLWLIPWSSNMSVKLQPAPKCETPTAFRGLLVKKLKVGEDLHCDTPLQPLLELKPDQDQVNFISIFDFQFRK